MKMMKRYRWILFIAAMTLVIAPISAQKTKSILILQTSDTHSQIEPVEQKGSNYNKGGFVRRVTMIDQMRKKHHDLLLFDCGDFCQGTPYFNLFKGDAEIDLMNQMKYNAGAIGNHDFDFGIDNMKRIYLRANYPIVCANYDCSSTVLKDIIKPYIILKRNGLRIGVFGLSPKLKGLVQAKNYGSLVYLDPIKTANQIASTLRTDEHCDVVICLSHLGYDYDIKLIKNTRNIDIVLGGHSHTIMTDVPSFANLDGKQIKVLHTGARGIRVGKIEMTLEEK
jgi:5'-nucleotidase